MHGKMKISAYTGKEPYIFISYAHKNDAEVFNILEELQKNHVRFYYDEGIEPSKEWAEELAKHIRRSMGMLVFMTPEYLQSERCQDELHFARDSNKPILVVYLRETKLSDGWAMQLNRKQSVPKYAFGSERSFYSKLLSAEMIACCRGKSNVVKFQTSAQTEIKKEIELEGASERSYTDEKENYTEVTIRNTVQNNETTAKELYLTAYTYWLSENADYKMALELFEKSAKLGLPDAYFSLGVMYLNGHGVEENWERTVENWEKAAEKSYLKAQCALGDAYYHGVYLDSGVSVRSDLYYALKWFERAADQGSEYAQLMAGKCYKKRGDYEKAAFYFEQLTKNMSLSYEEAYYELACCYLEGKGVKRNVKKSRQLFCYAAELGSIDAEIKLRKSSFLLGTFGWESRSIRREKAKMMRKIVGTNPISPSNDWPLPPDELIDSKLTCNRVTKPLPHYFPSLIES